MVMNNEDKREQQIKFEKNLITFPYLGFAIVVLLFNIFIQILKYLWLYLDYSLHII